MYAHLVIIVFIPAIVTITEHVRVTVDIVKTDVTQLLVDKHLGMVQVVKLVSRKLA